MTLGKKVRKEKGEVEFLTPGCNTGFWSMFICCIAELEIVLAVVDVDDVIFSVSDSFFTVFIFGKTELVMDTRDIGLTSILDGCCDFRTAFSKIVFG